MSLHDFIPCRCGTTDPASILVHRVPAPHQLRGDLYVAICSNCGLAAPFVSVSMGYDTVQEAVKAWNATLRAETSPLSALVTKWRDKDRRKHSAPTDLSECADELEAALAGGGEAVAYRWAWNDGGKDSWLDTPISPDELAWGESQKGQGRWELAFPRPAGAVQVTDEDRVDAALTAYNRAEYEWNKRPQDSRDEPRHRFSMRAAIAALNPGGSRE